MTTFLAPDTSFSGLDADAVASLLASAGDVTLVLDAKGAVQDIAFGNEELLREVGEKWIGRHWADTVTIESRVKIEALMREASTGSPSRWRHVNHPSSQGGDIAIQYTVVQVGPDGRMVAVGRDLRGISALQQRLVAAQQSLERDHARLRQIEMRYRLLYQATPEAVLIVEGPGFKVAEANPAAATLLAGPVEPLTGRSLPDLFDAAGIEAVQTLVSGVRATGRQDELTAGLADGRQVRVAASAFRHDGGLLFLVRLAPVAAGIPAAGKPRDSFAGVVGRLPDAFVVTDLDGRVVEANAAFLDLTQLATAEQARGQSLEQWLGRPGVDLSVLIANLRQHGSVRLYATTMRGEFGASADIEVSAALLPEGEGPGIGFAIRDVGRRLTPETRSPELPRSVEQLKELVGRVPLKDLVRETTDVVEQLCIEAALELTGDNRASAAEILGLSRQSLYVKLRRYGLGDTEAEVE